MEWQPEYCVDIERMDTTHREFVDIVSKLEVADSADFARLFHDLVTHTRAHFAEEDRWMNESAFPVTFIHIEEHARVLNWLNAVDAQIQEDGADRGRQILPELVDWFSNHAQTLDRALATHMHRCGYLPPPTIIF